VLTLVCFQQPFEPERVYVHGLSSHSDELRGWDWVSQTLPVTVLFLLADRPKSQQNCLQIRLPVQFFLLSEVEQRACKRKLISGDLHNIRVAFLE